MVNPASSIVSLPEAKAIIEAAAEAGEGYANWKLAVSYLDGRFGEYSVIKAAEHLKVACEKGIYFAPYSMANLLEVHSIDAKLFGSREYYLRLGATLGHACSQLNFAKFLMFRSCGEQQMLKEARHWFQLAEWNGLMEGRAYRAYIDAMNAPAMASPSESSDRLFCEGLAGCTAARRAFAVFSSNLQISGFPRHYDVDVLKECVKIGDKEAACELFDWRNSGKIADDDFELSAAKLFGTLLSEKHPRACHLQACRLLDKGYVDPINTQIARQLIEISAKTGYLPAQIDLAEILFAEGGETNMVEALSLLEDAATKGLTQNVESKIAAVAKSLLDLSKDDSSYIHGIRIGALGDCDLAFFMAVHYSGQRGYSRDPVKVLFWLHVAVSEGMAFAAHGLAQEFSCSPGDIPVNFPLALKYFEFAATNGVALACASLGDYFSGKQSHRIQNLSMAFHWYQKGAFLGYTYCMRELVYIYANGYGTSVDLKEAAHWQAALEAAQTEESKDKESIAKPSIVEQVEKPLAKVIEFRVINLNTAQ